MQTSQQTHPIVQAVRTLMARFIQNPNVYDIKFYKNFQSQEIEKNL